jgi:hypothetical protein
MVVAQDSKDEHILTSIQNYFGVGKVYQQINGVSRFRLAVKEEIIDKLVPHFTDHPLDGNKVLQYNIWIQIVQILIENPERSQERDNKIGILIRDLSNL